MTNEPTNPHLNDETAEAMAPDLTEAPKDGDGLSPEAQAAFAAVLALEDEAEEMLERADAENEKAVSVAADLEAAEDALSEAEARAIVRPGAEAAEASNAAERRVGELRDAKAKHTRAAEVLRAESAKMGAGVDEARREAFRMACADFEAIVATASSEIDSKLAELVPALKRKAAAIEARARLAGGHAGAAAHAVAGPIGTIEAVLQAAGERANVWRSPDPEISVIRQHAAYTAPDPEAIPNDWVDESLRDRLSARRTRYVEAKAAELHRRQEEIALQSSPGYRMQREAERKAAFRKQQGEARKAG